jgi:ABC-type Fe3+ transport system substrate-binding protein
LKGSGESFAQIAAERANPKLDLWFGSTGDPHLQAAEQGLTEEYKSPMLSQLQPWAQKQAEQSKLINYDFAKYGASAERQRLLEKWDKDVGSQMK